MLTSVVDEVEGRGKQAVETKRVRTQLRPRSTTTGALATQGNPAPSPTPPLKLEPLSSLEYSVHCSPPSSLVAVATTRRTNLSSSFAPAHRPTSNIFLLGEHRLHTHSSFKLTWSRPDFVSPTDPCERFVSAGVMTSQAGQRLSQHDVRARVRFAPLLSLSSSTLLPLAHHPLTHTT